MNRLVSELTSRNDHKLAVCQLYRALLRKTNQLASIPASINKFELKYNIQERFRSNYGSTFQISEQILKGITLNEALSLALGGYWDDLKQFIDIQRKEVFLYQKRRADYLTNKEKIEESAKKTARGKVKRNLLARSRRKTKYYAPDLRMPDSEQQFIKDGLANAKYQGDTVLKQFLHELQSLKKIPDPKLLPYSPELIFTAGDNLNFDHIIRGTSSKSLENFDQDILKAIVIPAMEYDINKLYLDQLKSDLDNKGPYKATVHEALAGTVPVPYIMQPTKKKIGREEIAKLIKKQIFFRRMINIWESQTHLTEENKQKDGSYPIKGSHGFGPEELVYPREYYQELYDAEEMYEILLQIHINEMNGKPSDPLDLEQFSWSESLDIASNYLRDAYKQVIQDSKMDLKELQDHLQKSFNNHYDEQVEKYERLITNLQKHNVFKHSEIVSPPGSRSIFDVAAKRSIDFFPKEEVFGKGKTLGEFMAESGFKHYKHGYKLTKRIAQIMRKLGKDF